MCMQLSWYSHFLTNAWDGSFLNGTHPLLILLVSSEFLQIFHVSDLKKNPASGEHQSKVNTCAPTNDILTRASQLLTTQTSQIHAMLWFFLMNNTCGSQFWGGLSSFTQLFLAAGWFSALPGGNILPVITVISALTREWWNEMMCLSSTQMSPVKRPLEPDGVLWCTWRNTHAHECDLFCVCNILA